VKLTVTQELKTLDGTPLGKTQEVAVVNEKNQFIKNERGDVAVITIPAEGASTLRDICIAALMTDNPENRVNGQEKYRRYELATKIKKNDTVEVTTDEIVLIKNLIAEIYPPLVLGQAFDMLEGKC